jgi:hypothetical protein
MAIKGISCDQAMVRLDNDFHLGLTGRKSTLRERALEAAQAKQRKTAVAMLTQAARDAQGAADAAFAWWRFLRNCIDRLRPADPAAEINPLWAYAQQHIHEAYDTAQRAEDEVVEAWNRTRQQYAT